MAALWTWHHGLPVLLVIGGVAAVVGAIRSDPRLLPRYSVRDEAWFGLLLIWTGDAALGEHRPFVERLWKGVFAAFLWLSFGISVWRRRRHRNAAEKRDQAVD